MNRKAQALGLAMILGTFMAVLVGVVLFQAVAQEAGKGSATVTANDTVTVPASGATIDLDGQELLSTPAVYNSSLSLVATTNYTIDEGVSATTGVKSVQYTALDGTHEGETINVSYTYGPDGYIDSSGGRAVASLIALFFALGIAIVALIPSVRSGLLGMFK